MVGIRNCWSSKSLAKNNYKCGKKSCLLKKTTRLHLSLTIAKRHAFNLLLPCILFCFQVHPKLQSLCLFNLHLRPHLFTWLRAHDIAYPMWTSKHSELIYTSYRQMPEYIVNKSDGYVPSHQRLQCRCRCKVDETTSYFLFFIVWCLVLGKMSTWTTQKRSSPVHTYFFVQTMSSTSRRKNGHFHYPRLQGMCTIYWGIVPSPPIWY